MILVDIILNYDKYTYMEQDIILIEQQINSEKLVDVIMEASEQQSAAMSADQFRAWLASV